MGEGEWLDDTEQRAWQGMLGFARRSLLEIQRGLDAHDMLAVHYDILATLSAAADQTLQLSDLASTVGSSQSRLTQRLKLLIERGEVEVTPSPDDGRVKYATLTSAGTQRLRAVAPDHVRDVRRIVFDHLDAHETQVLAEAFTKIAANLQEQSRRGANGSSKN